VNGCEADLLTLETDRVAGAEPLLVQVMAGGRRSSPRETLDEIRARAAAQLERLPERLKRLEGAEPPYEVEISGALREYAAQTPLG